MKKIKKFFKRNIGIVIAFILGIMVPVFGTYATTTPLYTANQIGYDNTNSGLEIESGNVKEALDVLYDKAATCEFGDESTSVSTISFTINGDSYTAEEGMTWADWIGSSYDTSGGLVRLWCDGTVLYNNQHIAYNYQSTITSTAYSSWSEPLASCGGKD